MNLQIFIKEALIERFKANATVKALEKQIESIAEIKIYEKYCDKLFFKDNMEFEFLGSTVKCSSYNDGFTSVIFANLVFTSKSKLAKHKREKLEKVKVKYETHQTLEQNSYKIPIWIELRYKLKIEDVLSGNINLQIESDPKIYIPKKKQNKSIAV